MRLSAARTVGWSGALDRSTQDGPCRIRSIKRTQRPPADEMEDGKTGHLIEQALGEARDSAIQI